MEFNFNEIMDDMKKAFKLSKKEVKAFKASPVFKVAASIPYLADCEDADRAAYVHLSSLITASRLGNHPVMSFRKDDLSSLNRRLQYVFNFKGGDKAIIAYGKNLMKYYMLLDYKKDYESDKKIGKENPVDPKYNFDIDKELDKLKVIVDQSTEFDFLFKETAGATARAAGFWRV